MSKQRPNAQLSLDALLASCDRQAQHITQIVARYRATRGPLTDDQRIRSRPQTIIRRPKYSISILPTACEWCGSDLVAQPRGGYACRNHDELIQDAVPGELQILREVDLTEGERAEYEEAVRTVRAAWRRREARAGVDLIREMDSASGEAVLA